MRTPPLLVPLVLILACSGPVDVVVGEDPIAPPDPPAAAQFRLISVNGQSLPADPPTGAGQWDYGMPPLTVIRATLKLMLDGTYELTWVHGVSGGTVAISEMVCRGTYVRDGDTIFFDGARGTVGTLTSSGLTWQWAEHSLLTFVERQSVP